MGELFYISVQVGDVVNSIGLASDIVGAVLLFRFGLPSKWQTVPLRSLEDDETEEGKRNDFNRKIQRGANWGLGLLIFGFTLQLLATWI
jgi:hypothetical protein